MVQSYIPKTNIIKNNIKGADETNSIDQKETIDSILFEGGMFCKTIFSSLAMAFLEYSFFLVLCVMFLFCVVFFIFCRYGYFGGAF